MNSAIERESRSEKFEERLSGRWQWRVERTVDGRKERNCGCLEDIGIDVNEVLGAGSVFKGMAEPRSQQKPLGRWWGGRE